ncbi:unnamed protein product [Meloidogyne enterolobii]|uniref:Uncharacterized protein n=1 Tax=Meloidogyne enterolobii TaxID=390850 RepID=A0ACB0ZLR8_MELEN
MQISFVCCDFLFFFLYPFASKSFSHQNIILLLYCIVFNSLFSTKFFFILPIYFSF